MSTTNKNSRQAKEEQAKDFQDLATGIIEGFPQDAKDAQDAKGQEQDRIKAVFAGMGLDSLSPEKLIELLGGREKAIAIAAANIRDQKQVELEARIKGLAESIGLPFLEIGETYAVTLSHDNGEYTVSVRRFPSPDALKGAKGGGAKGGGARPLIVVLNGKSLGAFPSAAEFCRLHSIDVPARSSAVQVLKGKGYSVEHTE